MKDKSWLLIGGRGYLRVSGDKIRSVLRVPRHLLGGEKGVVPSAGLQLPRSARSLLSNG